MVVWKGCWMTHFIILIITITTTINITTTASAATTTTIHRLSSRRDGSHHNEWDLSWARSPIREWHIRWQIWHSKLLVSGGPDLHGSRLDSNSWMHHISNFSTADLHEECQPALSIASASSSEGAIPQRFNVDLRQSLYHLYCPPEHREPWWSCPQKTCLGIRVSSIQITCPHQHLKSSVKLYENCYLPMIAHY